MNEHIIKSIVKTAITEAIAISDGQVSLAEKSGLSQGAISKYLRGISLPRGESAKKLEKAVDKKISRKRFAPHIFDDE